MNDLLRPPGHYPFVHRKWGPRAQSPKDAKSEGTRPKKGSHLRGPRLQGKGILKRIHRSVKQRHHSGGARVLNP